jgi:hypothetical protein
MSEKMDSRGAVSTGIAADKGSYPFREFLFGRGFGAQNTSWRQQVQGRNGRNRLLRIIHMVGGIEKDQVERGARQAGKGCKNFRANKLCAILEGAVLKVGSDQACGPGIVLDKDSPVRPAAQRFKCHGSGAGEKIENAFSAKSTETAQQNTEKRFAYPVGRGADSSSGKGGKTFSTCGSADDAHEYRDPPAIERPRK